MIYCANSTCIFRGYGGECIYDDPQCLNRPRQVKQNSKPPLGVMSRDMWDRKRQEDLGEAMYRYLEADMKIPKEWLDEYNEISDRWEKKE